MGKEKLIETIIFNSLQKVNKLLPKNEKINAKKFKIKNNSVFDSLNYVTFIVDINKNFKSKFKKDPKLFNQNVFKDKDDILNYLMKIQDEKKN